ncbi:MAG TPA: glycogen synthase GlgA [Thermodesulfobacteriota bacterium]|nr:glycogen synthase GlgA [Thermodesulfobacteriota bacterium]
MLKVLFVSPEAVPFAKTGGLADVSGALPKALKNIGIDVRLVLPFYRMVREQKYNYQQVAEDLEINLGNRTLKGSIKGLLDWENTFPVYFLEKEEFYDRSNLYGTPKGDYFDNAERFIFFSKLVFELCKKLQFFPDVIHCNDWQSGLVPCYLKTLFKRDPQFAKVASVFSIHNLAYQGIFPADDFALTGLPQELFSISGIEYWGKISFLKAGIVFADIINTVSKKYSQEIQTPEFGYGFDEILRARQKDLYGVLNGADYEEWNPATDKFIASPYSSEDLAGKLKCKQDLLRAFTLPEDLISLPLLGVISRLADQKGFDLLAQIMDELMKMDLGFLLLGTGEEKYHELFTLIGKKYPKKTGIKIAYDNTLAHKIEAGCDMFLMPSRYEPCGLNQMYSLKYGTIPIVRATGGLDDTIQEFNPISGKGTGFKFKNYEANELLKTIKKALAIYHDKVKWTKLIRNAMKADFSWKMSAKKYVELYRKALAKLRTPRN